MESLSALSFVFGTSWLSGIRLYATVAALGIADRLDWIVLPGELETLGHPLVILVAGVLAAGEFLADKIPAVDSLWDSVHTFIRPLGGALLAFGATSDLAPAFQVAAALTGGGIALTTHSVKATSRAAINTSPEPVSNVVTSSAEDGLLLGGFWLLLQHPWVLFVVVILFLIFAVWFLNKMVALVKRLFGRRQTAPSETG